MCFARHTSLFLIFFLFSSFVHKTILYNDTIFSDSRGQDNPDESDSCAGQNIILSKIKKFRESNKFPFFFMYKRQRCSHSSVEARRLHMTTSSSCGSQACISCSLRDSQGFLLPCLSRCPSFSPFVLTVVSAAHALPLADQTRCYCTHAMHNKSMKKSFMSQK